MCLNEQERAVDLFWVAAEEQSREEGDISQAPLSPLVLSGHAYLSRILNTYIRIERSLYLCPGGTKGQSSRKLMLRPPAKRDKSSSLSFSFSLISQSLRDRGMIVQSRNAFKSTSCGRWRVQTRHTPASRSTSVERWRATRESIHRSIQSISSLVGR